MRRSSIRYHGMSRQLARDLARGGLLPQVRDSVASQYVGVKATAKLLGVSESFLNKARLSGSGPPFAKFGHSVRYDVAVVLGWAAAQQRHSTSDQGEVA